MTIEWNKVTWYSKLCAAVLFVATFFLGFWLGTMKVEKVLVFVPYPTGIHHAINPIVTISTPATTTDNPAPRKILPYGKVTLQLGDLATFKDNSITLLETMAESRCPKGVTCIWAGTLKAKILSVTGMGKSTEVVELGKSLTTEAEIITFLSATPYPEQGKNIAPQDYRLTFEVVKRSLVKPVIPVSPPTTLGACYTGGCSGQICSDKEGLMSTCEFREEYACYQGATCERQVSGACGWTSTPQLDMCLSAAR